MKILVVDADWRFVAQVTPYLEAHAHLVVDQNKPGEAAKQVQQWQPDLVMLSADLANENLVKAIYGLKNRPAVLLTENMDRYDRAWRTWQHCGDELLMKPVFRAEELHQAIVMALENATANAKPRRRLAKSA